jgi:hypothetical protein
MPQSQARSLIEAVTQGADPAQAVDERAIMPVKGDKPKEMGLDLSELAVSTLATLDKYHAIFSKRDQSGETLHAYDQARLAISAAKDALRKVQGAGDHLFHVAKDDDED